MPVRPAYRDRDGTQVAVLDALAARGDDGMTVLELRGRVDADIDDIEAALSDLKEDGLIVVEQDDERTLLKAADRVTTAEPSEPEQSFFEWLRDRLPP
jgi:DNA-binding transcriptional ArsR family regulator